MTGPKRTALLPGELIEAVSVPVFSGWQGYAKVGVRNAMVISNAGACLAVDDAGECGWHSARSGRPSFGAPRPRRSPRRSSTTTTRSVADADATEFGRSGRGRVAADRRSSLHRRVPTTRGRGAGPPSVAEGVPKWLRAAALRPARQRDTARSRRRLDRREPAVCVARATRNARVSKGACEQGECGSCSVMVDDELVCSCLVLAASAVGQEIVTIEGIAPLGSPTDVQRAFVECGAVQCGFCTPGLIMAAHASAGTHRRSRPRPRSARSCPATSADAPATDGSSRPCSGSRSRGADQQ